MRRENLGYHHQGPEPFTSAIQGAYKNVRAHTYHSMEGGVWETSSNSNFPRESV